MALFSGNLRSSVLGMDTGVSVVLPYDRPSENLKYPCKVLYLLHGLGNNYSSWSNNTGIERYARQHGVAVIMPDAQKSFYQDMVMGEAYFTYITEELPNLCQKMFHLSTERENTSIAGLSMGGYGAMRCALTKPEQYSTCASFSGVLDLEFVIQVAESQIDKNKLKTIFGLDLKVPDESNLYYLVEKIIQSKQHTLPNIYITCGTEDYLYQINQEFVQFLKNKKVSFTYEEWQGKHDWDFWDESVKRLFSTFGV